jgi:hypothetical protein
MIINEFAGDGLEIDLLLETTRSFVPKTKLPTSYYLAEDE